MTEHYTNEPFVSLHEWQVGSIFMTESGLILKMTKVYGHMYAMATLEDMVEKEENRYWHNGIYVQESNRVRALNIVKVVVGSRLEIPRCPTDYYDLNKGSTVLLSNGDIAVISAHLCKPCGEKTVVCTPVASVPDENSISDPDNNDDVYFTQFGFGTQGDSIYIVTALYKIQSKVVFDMISR